MDSNKANVGTFYLTIPILILTAIAVGIMAYNQLFPRTANTQTAPVDNGGAWMSSGWLPIIIIAGLLSLAVVLQVFLGLRLRKNKGLRSQVAELMASSSSLANDLSEANRKFANTNRGKLNAEAERDGLKNQVSRLQSELEAVNRVGGDTRSELDRLQSELNELHAVSEDTKWLREIVQEQSQTLYRFVHLTNLQYLKHELMRSDPYIEFSMNVDNRSLFDVSFSDLSGSISYGEREFSATPTWQSRSPLTQGNAGTVSFRLRLSEEDVIHIFNDMAGNREVGFEFGKLLIQVDGNHGLKPSTLQIHRVPLRNTELLQKYPKLNIEISNAVYDWINSMGTKASSPTRNPCYVTLLLSVTNRRHRTIEVETYKLIVSVKGTTHIAFADSGKEVHPHRYITDEGFEAVGHQAFPNLNHATPLVCREEKPISGAALQFVFHDLNLADFLYDPDSLNDTPFMLELIDKNGERHPAHGTLTPRDKVASLFESS